MIRLLLPLLTLLVAFTSSASSGTWSLDKAIVGATSNQQLPVELEDGPFHIKATLNLHRLGGTAAGIRIGDSLLFGFDARNGSLFVEGRAVGRTKLLDAPNPLEANKAFAFNVRRDADNRTSFSLDGREVFTTDKLTGPVDHLTIRPLRNRMDVMALTVSGSLRHPSNEVIVDQSIIPLLNDGSDLALLDLNIRVKEATTLKSVRLSFAGTTDTKDIRKLTLFRNTSANQRRTDQPTTVSSDIQSTTTLAANLPLKQGSNHFWLAVQITPGADLMHQVTVTVESVALEDGRTMSPPSTSPSPMRLAYAIHKQGQHNCHTFRIPALTKANDGSLLAVYDMRYNSARDLQEHMDIGLSRSTDGGQTWAPPVPIMDMGEYGGKPQKENGCSDPGILVDTQTGEIIVTACWTHGKPNTHQWVGKGSEPGHEIGVSTQFMAVRSSDHGRTWSQPENWTQSIKDPAWYLFAPAPGNGITMSNGTLVIPTQGRDANGHPFSNITWSKDRGKTWHVSSPARTNTTECAVAQLSDGSLMLSMRDNRNRHLKDHTNGRAVATTRDLGETWQKHSADHGLLPEPVCMASLISTTLPDGRHVLLFSNPRDKHHRRNMTIQLSLDDGKSWPQQRHILLDEGRGYGYSSLVMIDAQTIGIVYESSVADMTFQKIPLADFAIPQPAQSAD
ncbi:sialidase family protein [Sulfuriroseicoccus oceanibius]|uniref:exo-alpha-sialidase n=1 Tax=Sulfuriroseicoccus oceanibius TaxID=2707525 RepID=A0A7T7F306_9BACT|nr:sialidase family protein [Sulfuriroseicoccus oceanibius]QQL45885.1 exo-alpha-sialidase [Sulfuriroseicoccus oceanibius]